ncbi:hypothetical protein 7S2_18 [uncultured Caudovirales phage]|uniref:Uncharacterized protein n=1 Tax=uncultured Caudovirales phage TaxID=2100421 RepID=A0A2H4JH20_9CAUD|nr:hypothetical protein 7S2_18 [uncultured Caudovirales phage]
MSTVSTSEAITIGALIGIVTIALVPVVVVAGSFVLEWVRKKVIIRWLPPRKTDVLAAVGAAVATSRWTWTAWVCSVRLTISRDSQRHLIEDSRFWDVKHAINDEVRKHREKAAEGGDQP